ncbi:MAG: 3-hydroxy-3-methylglutaryl-CoA reductase, partial [Proteobacteria bacterium]|nr:3-hydroxy-3-methylglutaryl-CoA reductase [Pseudomonadota bacterium]
MPNRPEISSRIAGFYRKSLGQRRAHIDESGRLSAESRTWLAQGGGLATSIADCMSENVVATTGLPLGI